MDEAAREGVARPRLVVAITGASGVVYGIRLLEHLQDRGVETHLIVSRAGVATIRAETSYSLAAVESLADVVYRPGNIGAAIASGSFRTIGMLVVPCSIKTLSGIANSYSADLVTRAADVILKEGRPLVLAVRESPLHLGHLRLMEQATLAGAVIAPPAPAFYHRPEDLDAVIDHTVVRLLARVGLPEPGAREWQGLNAEADRDGGRDQTAR